MNGVIFVNGVSVFFKEELEEMCSVCLQVVEKIASSLSAKWSNGIRYITLKVRSKMMTIFGLLNQNTKYING